MWWGCDEEIVMMMINGKGKREYHWGKVGCALRAPVCWYGLSTHLSPHPMGGHCKSSCNRACVSSPLPSKHKHLAHHTGHMPCKPLLISILLPRFHVLFSFCPPSRCLWWSARSWHMLFLHSFMGTLSPSVTVHTYTHTHTHWGDKLAV